VKFIWGAKKLRKLEKIAFFEKIPFLPAGPLPTLVCIRKTSGTNTVFGKVGMNTVFIFDQYSID
jgi:hypothetical protein